LKLKNRFRLPTIEGFNYPLLLAAYLGLFYFGMTDNGRGPAYPQIIRELGLSNREGSFLFALSSFMSFLVPLTSSRWLAKVDLYRAIRASWGFLSLACISIGLSGLWRVAPLLFLGSIFLGMGMGTCGMSMNLMIEAGTPVSHRRRAFGGLHATYGIASFLAPILFRFLMGFGFEWESFFFTMAFVGPLIIFFTPTPETTYALVPNKDSNQKLPLTFLLTLGLCVGTYVASEIVISSRLVLFLEEGLGLSNGEASLYLSGFFILLMLGRLSLSLIHLPIRGEYLLLGSLLLTTIFCLLGMQGHLVFFSLCGLSMSIFFPSFMDWLAETFPEDFQKTTAFVMSGIGIHLVAMHLGFGNLAETLGVVKAMGLALILTLISLVFLGVAFLWSHSLKKKLN